MPGFVGFPQQQRGVQGLGCRSVDAQLVFTLVILFGLRGGRSGGDSSGWGCPTLSRRICSLEVSLFLDFLLAGVAH